MKVKLLVIASLALLGVTLPAGPIRDISFAWDPNPESDQVSSYHIYERVVANGATNHVRLVTVPGTQTQATVPGLEWTGPRTFVATAENYIAESDWSNPVVVAWKPGAPTEFRLTPR